MKAWLIFPVLQELIENSKWVVPRCLARSDREAAFLDPDPPYWCVDMEKWPFDTQEWKDWLKYKRANAEPPLPYMPEWEPWVAAHQ